MKENLVKSILSTHPKSQVCLKGLYNLIITQNPLFLYAQTIVLLVWHLKVL